MTKLDMKKVLDHAIDLRSYVTFEEQWKCDRLEGDIQNLIHCINKLKENINALYSTRNER